MKASQSRHWHFALALLACLHFAGSVTASDASCVATLNSRWSTMLPSITAAAGGDGKILGALNDKIILLYPFSSAATSFFVAGNTSYSSGPTSASNIVDGLGLKARFAAVTAMTYSDDFKSFVVVDYNTIRLISESDYNVTTVFQETRLINSQYISVYDRVAFVTIVAGNCVLRIDLVNPSSEVWLGVCSQVGVNVLTSAQSRLPLFVLPSISKVTALSSTSLLAYAGGWIYVDSSQVRPSSTTLPIDLTGFYGGTRQGPYSVDYYDSACNHVFIDDVRLAVPAIVLRPVIDNASFCSTGQPPLAVLKTDANISLVPYTTSTTQGTTVQVGLVQFTGCDEANASSVTTAPIVNNGGSPTPSPPPPLSPPSTRSPFDSKNNNTPPNGGGGGNKNDSGTIVVVIVVSLFGAIVLSLMAAAIYLCVTRKRGLAESDKEVTEREMTAIGVPRPLPTRRQNQDLDLRPLQQLSDPSMTGSTNRNNPGESPTMPSEMHQTADFTALRTTTGGNEQSPLTPQQHDKDVSLETLSQQNNNEMSRELRRHLRRCEYVMNNPYQKGKLLGRGANGSVYAVLLKDGSTIAMKEVNLIGTEDEIRELMKSVDSEAKLLKNLLHENLVTYYGVQCDHKHLTVRLFMENVTGGCLGAMVRSMDERLSEDTARVFTHQILKGLAFIHSHGIMHRDLKCDNILRDSHTGLIKLADFGTAKNVSNATNASRAAQTMIGTPYLMAPEILMAGMGETPDAGYGTKADIWSLGITVAEMLNKGNFPWPAFPSPGHAFLYIASPQGVPIMPDGLSPECQDFIRQCTDRDPKTRPNAEDLLTHEWFNALPEKEDSFSAGFANEHSAAD